MCKKRLFLIISIILIDQIIKNSIQNKVINYGASFNLLENYPKLIILISFLALILFIYFHIKSKENKTALLFLIAGTSSNLIDRLHFGYVIDYIPLPFLFTFNMADLSNTIGMILLILSMWKK